MSEKECGVPEPNYTQVPNIILDTMSHYGDAEFRIIMAICRKTFGYHKDSDTISLTQFQEMTGLSRQGVLNGLAGKVASRIIERVERGQSFGYRLRVVNEVDYWSTRLTTGGQRGRPEVVNEVDTQKKGKKPLKKDTPTRAREDFGFARQGKYWHKVKPEARGWSDAATIYTALTGGVPTGYELGHLGKIPNDPDSLGLFESVVIAWIEAPTRHEKQPVKLYDDWKKQRRTINESDDDRYSYEATPRSRARQDIDPASNFERNRQIARAALGLEP